jgi:hypothetical protein
VPTTSLLRGIFGFCWQMNTPRALCMRDPWPLFARQLASSTWFYLISRMFKAQRQRRHGFQTKRREGVRGQWRRLPVDLRMEIGPA